MSGEGFFSRAQNVNSSAVTGGRVTNSNVKGIEINFTVEHADTVNVCLGHAPTCKCQEQSKNVVTFYHYTNWNGKIGILESARIQEASKDMFGQGVYGTCLRPGAMSKRKLAWNNFGLAWKKKLTKGALDYAIEVDLPKKSTNIVEHCGRKIFIHEGEIDLKKYYNYSVHKVIDTDYCDDYPFPEGDDELVQECGGECSKCNAKIVQPW